MSRSIISRVVNSNCHSRSLTMKHLTRKLDRLNVRIMRADAKQYHYVQRDRVEKQLLEAQAYLC